MGGGSPQPETRAGAGGLQYQNARTNPGRRNAKIELDSALRRLITSMVMLQTKPNKAYAENGRLREWLNGQMLWTTYQEKT